MTEENTALGEGYCWKYSNYDIERVLDNFKYYILEEQKKITIANARIGAFEDAIREIKTNIKKVQND
jgi:hypothetical protein